MKIVGLSNRGQYSDTILCTQCPYAMIRMAARKDEDGAMCTEQTKASTLRDWLRDPMIRLMMESDGVTDEEMVALVRRVCAAVASRASTMTQASTMTHASQWRVPEQHCACAW